MTGTRAEKHGQIGPGSAWRRANKIISTGNVVMAAWREVEEERRLGGKVRGARQRPQPPKTTRFPLLQQSAQMTGLNGAQFVCFHLLSSYPFGPAGPGVHDCAAMRTQAAHGTRDPLPEKGLEPARSFVHRWRAHDWWPHGVAHPSNYRSQSYCMLLLIVITAQWVVPSN